MSNYKIVIVPYRPTWEDEFLTLGKALRQALGHLALRIDHIGSTAVPGLAAKNIIDIQITVQELAPAVEQALNDIGYQRMEHITQDHIPPQSASQADDWVKWMFTPVAPQRRVNVHVRLAGRVNQRYSLLFRDYLRSHATATHAYAQIKTALAHYHPDNVEAYYDVKDPVCDLIIEGAEAWATITQWQLAPSDC